MNILNEFQNPAPQLAILDGTDVVLTDDVILWATRRSKGEAHIAQEEVNGHWVSTIFLGVNMGSDEHPRWFETMVFATPTAEEIGPTAILELRTETYQQALQAHEMHKHFAACLPHPT